LGCEATGWPWSANETCGVSTPPFAYQVQPLGSWFNDSDMDSQRAVNNYSFGKYKRTEIDILQ